MIKYVKGDLFDAPKGSLLLHAVNCQGVWGSGIAKEFKKRFPGSYNSYKLRREEFNTRDLIGTFSFHYEYLYDVTYLFTSKHYGPYVCPINNILLNTESALIDLEQYLKYVHTDPINICSPKINSGLFKVPWEQTEKLIEEFLERNPQVTWTVYIKE